LFNPVKTFFSTTFYGSGSIRRMGQNSYDINGDKPRKNNWTTHNQFGTDHRPWLTN